MPEFGRDGIVGKEKLQRRYLDLVVEGKAIKITAPQARSLARALETASWTALKTDGVQVTVTAGGRVQ